jgi:hypothetical protein
VYAAAVWEICTPYCTGYRPYIWRGDDRIFLAYLVYVYASGHDSTRPKITVRKGRGGSANGVVGDAHRVPGSFNRKLIKLDRDRPQAEIDEAVRITQRHRMQIVFSVPCLEGMLLSILEPNNDYSRESSDTCKRSFESRYISHANRGKMAEYSRTFPKTMLDGEFLS